MPIFLKTRVIKRANRLTNFSDLYQIEDIWNQEKSVLSLKWKILHGAREKVEHWAKKIGQSIKIGQDFY